MRSTAQRLAAYARRCACRAASSACAYLNERAIGFEVKGLPRAVGEHRRDQIVVGELRKVLILELWQTRQIVALDVDMERAAVGIEPHRGIRQ